MKRLTSAFLLLLILCLYTYFSERYVLNLCHELDSLLETCATQIAQEEYSRAEITVNKLYSIWEEKDDILSVFIGDSSVTEPRKNIVTIQLSLKDENFQECMVNIRECQGYIHDIAENSSTGLINVL